MHDDHWLEVVRDRPLDFQHWTEEHRRSQRRYLIISLVLVAACLVGIALALRGA